MLSMMAISRHLDNKLMLLDPLTLDLTMLKELTPGTALR